MKRLIILAGIIMLFCVSAGAQPAAAGVTGKGFKIGFDVAKINTDYNGLDRYLESRVGFVAGAFITYSFSRRLAVQPEVLYVSKGAGMDLFSLNIDCGIDYLEIPVLLKFDLLPNGPAHPNLFLGPAAAILLNSKVNIGSYSFDLSKGMTRVDAGSVFGAGFDYENFTFDVRYTLGMMNIVEDAAKINNSLGAEPGDIYYLENGASGKNANISFMVGVRF